MNPPLTIIIPSRFRVDLLRDCLQSVTDHAPQETEILVIDDGSKDAAVSQMAARFPGVTIIRHARARGYCMAVNAGIKLARAPFVELLNDDTIVEPNWSDAALRAFADPSVAAVAPLVLRGRPGDIPVVDSAGDIYDPGGFAQPRGRGLSLPAGLQLPESIDGVSGCAGFFRTSVLSECFTVFPSSFSAYFEDVDLCCRLRQAGHRMVYAPGSRVWHRGGSSHVSSRRLLQQQSCNEERVFWRNTKGTPGELLRHAAVVGGKFLRRVHEGTVTPWFFGRLRAWTIEGRRRWTSSPIE